MDEGRLKLESQELMEHSLTLVKQIVVAHTRNQKLRTVLEQDEKLQAQVLKLQTLKNETMRLEAEKFVLTFSANRMAQLENELALSKRKTMKEKKNWLLFKKLSS